MLASPGTILPTGMGIVIAPAVAILLYGTARLVAKAVARWMPESALKRRLLTDTETGRLAYKPRPHGSTTKGRAGKQRDKTDP